MLVEGSNYIYVLAPKSLRPSYKEHMVDALALIGDEGRDKLRKAMGSCT